MEKEKRYKRPLAWIVAWLLYLAYMSITFSFVTGVATEYNAMLTIVFGVAFISLAIWLFGKIVGWSNNIYQSKFGLRYIVIAGIYALNAILTFLEVTDSLGSGYAGFAVALAYYLITSGVFVAWGVSKSR